MKFYFDENFSPHLIRGLQAFQVGRKNEGIEVVSVKDEFGAGTPDEVWLPKIAQQHGVAVTQDMNIQRLRHQWEICEHYKLGLVFFQPPRKGWNYWAVVQLVVKLWLEIRDECMRGRKPFGFIVSATSGRLKPLD